ncbi:uncharacterized protein [Typha angustifolia]|uniref:uncharacterized protein n=1 Tax=Typha angustifolia TaxID=59011 RepID=UPI003C2ADE01
MSRYAVHLVITSRMCRMRMWIAMYVSNNLQSQGELWEELPTLRGINVPWIIGGDFNAYISIHEKKSEVGVELGPKCKVFKAFVERIGLCDLGYVGLPFTWCNNQVGANRIWITREKVVRPFRFEMYWLKYGSCGRVVDRIWRQAGRANPMHDFMHKRSRLRWVNEGDRNSKYFHLLATISRQRNRIPGVLNTNDNSVQKTKGVGRLFSNFYKNLWGPEANTTPPRDEWPELPRLSLEDAQQLKAPVSHEEIKTALWSLPRGKAPGLDSLHAEVYIQYWEFMGGSLLKAVNHFFTSASLPIRWGKTFITLIPKRDHPTMAAFVARRSIMDNTLATQEVKHSMCSDRLSPPVMMAKLDMKKAYDRQAELSGSLGLQIAVLPFVYLGVIISGKRVKVREHQVLVDRVDKKFVSWK